MKKANLLVSSVMNSNPKNPEAYIAAAKLEEFSGRIVNARLLIQAGLEECPNNHDLIVESRRLASIPLMRGRENQDGWVTAAVDIWLADAKNNGLSGNLPLARKILRSACAAVPDSEELWLAALELEIDNHELENARMILAMARGGECGTKRVWLKSAIVERELGETAAGERKLLIDGLRRFPSFFKLWLMLGQLEERIGNLRQAKAAYLLGLAHCPKSVPLWVSLADVAEKSSWRVGFGERREGEGREILAMSLKINPKSPELWLAAIRAEIRLGNKEEADILMAKALEKCPKSGILWAASIEMAHRPQRKTKAEDAYKNCNKDGHVLAAIGKLFWEHGKVEKARNWLNRAVTIAPYIGDFWALYYKFEIENGSDENQKDVLKRCVAVGPKHGEKWQVVSKAVRNSRQPTEAILKKVCLLLESNQEISSILVLDL